MISRRACREHMQNALSLAFADANASGESVLDLTLSNPTRVGLHYPSEQIARVWAGSWQTSYRVQSLGYLKTREHLADHWFQRRFGAANGDPERIMLTASTSEAYSFLLKLLCDPGDEVLVPEPSYPLLEELAAYEHVRAVPYQLDHGSWEVDTDSVVRAKSRRTRAVLAVSPNNPTGSIVTRKEWYCLGELGLPIISDEVFGCYGKSVDGDFDQESLSALTCELDVPVFVMDGLSKRALLPQAKVAWTYLNNHTKHTDALVRHLELIADTFLSVAPNAQVAAPALIEVMGVVRQRAARRLRENLELLDRKLIQTAVTRHACVAGWSTILRLPRVMEEDAWVLKLMNSAQLKVQPGWFYDIQSGPNIVVSLLTQPDHFSLGVERLLECVGAEC